MQAHSLSVVVITFNEAANIEACLAACAGLATELVVVDSGSTDATCNIATESGARVVQQPFLGYVAQKNFVVNLAQCDWVLSLDADEVLDLALVDEIKICLQHSDYQGFALRRLNYYCGKPVHFGVWNPDIKTRIWRRGLGEWVGGQIHESLQVNGKIKILQGILHHHTLATVQQHKAQIRKFAALRAEEEKNKSKGVLVVKLVFSPIWRFLRGYVLKLGFLDGWRGLYIAALSGWGEVLKYGTALRLKKRV